MRTDSKTSIPAIIFVLLSFAVAFLSMFFNNISPIIHDFGWFIAIALFAIGGVFWIRNKR